MSRPISPAYANFRRLLTASTAETLAWWAANYPNRPLDAGVATGLCPRRFPTDRAGRIVLSADERLWAAGRTRYLTPGAPR